MSKKPKSILSDLGNIRKPERTEPEAPTANTPPKEKRGRGRPAERTPHVQLNARISLETSQQIDAIAQENGWTIRQVVEEAIDALHNK